MGCGASQPEGGMRPTPLAPAGAPAAPAVAAAPVAPAPTNKIEVAAAAAPVSNLDNAPQAPNAPDAPKAPEQKAPEAKKAEEHKAEEKKAPAVPITELFKPIKIGAIEAKNRFIMGPMSRNRASARTGVPGPLMVKYYAQRAKHAGLVITESTAIGAGVFGYRCPGIYSAAQIQEWRKVTDAVHAAGGKIVCQIAHGGRTAHPSNGPNAKDHSKNHPPYAPSKIRITSMQVPEHGNATGAKVDFVEPVELADKEIPAVIAMHVFAAKNAIAAGFDGVELHCANGFLLDQFWRASSNKRAGGKYSGESVETRSAFPLDVVAAVSAAIGADRVGIRISPLNSYHEMSDPEPEKLTRYLCEKLNDMHIAYVHLIRVDYFGIQKGDTVTWVRESFKGTVIGNAGYQPAEAEAAIHEKKVDAVAFASLFLANPDLPERVQKGAAFNEPIQAKFYTADNDADEEGYTSYPTLA